MARYTVLQEKEIAQISLHYGLSILSFEPIDGGHGNSSYLLTTSDGNLVATVFDESSFPMVSQLGMLLDYFAEKNFRTTRLVKPKNNREPVITLLDKPVLLKKFIPGSVYQSLDSNMLEQVGVEMAKLHEISAPDYLAKEHEYGRQLFPSVFDKSIDIEYEAWLSDRFNYLNRSIPEELPTCLIHGDLFYDNVLFEGNKLMAIIDFEGACDYYRVFDLGMGIVGMCTNQGNLDLDKAKAFLQGYQKVQLLEAREKISLQLFVEYAAIATSYWRFNKYNIHTPMPAKAKLHWQMVDIANQANAIPKKKFIEAVF